MKKKVLNWAQQFDTFCFLDNHQYQIEPHSMECLLAAGVKNKINGNAGNGLRELQQFIDKNRNCLFGHLGYDLKNETRKIVSERFDRLHFPDYFFFEPEIIIRITNDSIKIESEKNNRKILQDILTLNFTSELENNSDLLQIENRISKQEYLEIIEKLKYHIHRGDCYEINFCQEFFAEEAIIDPLEVYQKLSSLSPNPFSAFYKLEDKFLICASPERFLKKEGGKILSQPIKGTSSRFLQDKINDEKSRQDLYASEKDRSENVMVVDLVRNDLSRICKEGTVKLEELYGIYSFPQVHQMISTVSGELKENVSFTEIIRATFPMGSMTGAPKKRVMELIDQYEETKRGIFSGALGYIDPGGDLPAGQAGFDFNVIIRSILYNASDKYLSFLVGSGITFLSDAEKEYEECLLKAKAILSVLKN